MISCGCLYQCYLSLQTFDLHAWCVCVCVWSTRTRMKRWVEAGSSKYMNWGPSQVIKWLVKSMGCRVRRMWLTAAYQWWPWTENCSHDDPVPQGCIGVLPLGNYVNSTICLIFLGWFSFFHVWNGDNKSLYIIRQLGETSKGPMQCQGANTY